MADKKTNEEVEVLYSGLLAKHILRGASDDSSGNFFIYFSKLINGILNPVTMTVAEAQAAAIALEFKPGQRIIISNPYGSANNEFRTHAKTTSELEGTGHGTFRNAAMSASIECIMGYDLTANFITLIHDTEKNNYCVQTSGASIDKYRLDSANFFGNTLVDLVGIWSATNVRMTNCIFRLGGGTLNLTGEACLLNGIIADGPVTVSLTSDTANYVAINLVGIDWGVWIDNTTLGVNCSLSLYAASIIGCVIGESRTLATGDLSAGYVANSKTYNNHFSNFEMDGTFRPALNPDASGIISVTNCEWVGKIIITDLTANSNVITITGLLADHDYTIQTADAIGGDCTLHDVSDSGDNIYLEATMFVIRDSFGDSITVGAHPKNVAAFVRQVTTIKPLTQAV